MITISVKLKDDNYMPKVDTAFEKIANMIKIIDGKYESDGDVLTDCYMSAKALMTKQWFIDNVLSMKWIVDDEPEEDLVAHFKKRILKEGSLKWVYQKKL